MFTLPDLGYAYDALGENISKDIMELHHKKHHQTYVDKLNAALEGQSELAGKSVIELISNLDAVPESIRGAVRNHGGGHYNHSLFWKVMTPDRGGEPVGELNTNIIHKYGSFDAFKTEFTTKALAVFGADGRG